MRAIKKIVATTGKTAQGKAVYQRIGTMFKRDDGTFTIKIDALPVGCPEWTGWANLYDMDPPKQEAAPQPNDDEDMPF